MKITVVIALALALSACSEKPQHAGRADVAPAWQGSDDAYALGDWKRGDRASWEQALRARAMSQNEYRRIGSSR